MKSRAIVAICCGTLVLACSALIVAAAPVKTSASSPAVERARREVHLLDDVYKSAIVLITEHYVDDKHSLAAGTAFKVLFKSMKDKGWHEVRLIDALGEPINPENSPRDDFEREAVKQMLAGKTYYERIETKNGKQYLHAATPIPLVMEKCTMCHDNFKGKKVVGALGYTLPLDVKTYKP